MIENPTPTTHHTAENLQKKAIGLVQDYYNVYVVPAFDYLGPISAEEIFVVWFCKTLQNWKALVSTHRPDDRYYEVTYDGDKKRTYIDQYDKVDNKVVNDNFRLPQDFNLFSRLPQELFTTHHEDAQTKMIERPSEDV